MSKNTIRLNTQVHLGKTLYVAGKPVPVGKGKDMLSEEEAANLVANFGLFQGDAEIGAPGLDADIAARDARIVELQRERDDAGTRLGEAEKLSRDLQDKLAEAGTARAGLERQVLELERKLSDSGDAAETEKAIKILRDENAQLEKDNGVLAKRVKELEDAKK